MRRRRVAWVAVAALVASAGCGQRLARPLAPQARPPAASGRQAASASPAGEVHDALLASPAPRGPAAETAVAPPKPPPDRRFALLIGVDDYAGTEHDLGTAIDDARTMRTALLALGVPRSHIRLVRDPPAEEIVGAVRWLASKAKRGATGVLLFAGHAKQVGGDPDGDGELEDEVLVGSDLRWVSDGALARLLAPARGSLWLLVATCNAAGFEDAGAPGRVLSYASGEEQDAFESEQLGGSFMVDVLIRRGMLGSGLVSAEATHRFADRWMVRGWRKYLPLVDDRHPGDLQLLGPRA